jgi:hypothetical protein
VIAAAGQSGAAAEYCQGGAHAQPVGRANGCFQYVAHLGLGAAAMHCSPHAQGAMYLLGQIPDSQRCHCILMLSMTAKWCV